MLFARPTEYAIRALCRLASQEPGALLGAREISRSERVPMPFLWKILQVLKKGKVVRSRKGIGGGYELAAPPDRITLGAVAHLTEGTDFRQNCALGLPRCNNRKPCRLHQQWKLIRGDIAGMLDETSLADLVRAGGTKPRAGKRRRAATSGC